MSVADWRRAFALGYLLAAAHSLRLLDVVVQVAWRAAGVPVRRFVAALLARMATAPPASALGRIHAVLERHADAVLAGEAMALPLAETGDHLWAVEDAVVVTALGAGEAFFDEVRALVREDLRDADSALLEDAVRFQRLVTPAFGCAPRGAMSSRTTSSPGGCWPRRRRPRGAAAPHVRDVPTRPDPGGGRRPGGLRRGVPDGGARADATGRLTTAGRRARDGEVGGRGKCYNVAP